MKTNALARILFVLFCGVHRAAGTAGRGIVMVALLVSASGLASRLMAQTGGGTIEGTVMNASTGTTLNNARIAVEGTRLETFSDDAGRYRLTGVPAGEARLHATYTGFDSQSATVLVAAGGTVGRDFELSLPRNQTTVTDKEVVKLENFVVESTTLSAQAAAINEQKMAPNIMNVVVLDEIGDLGDGNIGEYLKYTPGMSITGGPQTAASASIRGLPGSGIVVMIDGAQVSSPGADRTYDLAASSSGSVDRIEITKVPTPDRPANAVGGTVNIIGKSGFNLPRRSLRLSTYAAYNSDNRLVPPGLNERLGSDSHSSARAIQPGIDINYSHPVNKSFAFTINLSEMTRVYDMDYDSPTWDLIRGVQTTNSEQNVLQATERQLASTTFDWKFSRRDSLRLNLEHVQINTPTRQNIFTSIWGASNTGGATFTQGAPGGGDTVRQTATYGDRTRGTSTAVLRYVHDGALYKIDGYVNYSRSWDHRDDINHGFFRTIGNAQQGSLVLRADGWDGVYSRRSPTLIAFSRTGQPVDPYDNANLTLGNPTSQPNEILSDMKSVAANIARTFDLKLPTVVKAGFLINRQRKDNTSTLKTWTFSPPAGVSRLVKDYDLTNESLSQQTFFSDTLKVKWVSPTKYFDLFKAHPDWFVLGDAAAYQSGVTNSKYFEETISAGYVRTDVKLLENRLWLVAGARYERTEDYGAGPLNEPRNTYQQDANGNLLRDSAGRLIPKTTDPLATAKLRYIERGTEAHRSYSDVYPSVNASYYITDALVGRAAFAQTLGRPSLADIIPGVTISDPTSAAHTATIVNSGLKPWSANNYDLSFEGYGVKGAVVAFSLFRKDVRDFFVDTRIPATAELLQSFGLSDDYLDYDIISTKNGGSATVKGYEVSWRQAWFFLPAWAKGFSTFANATISKVSGENATDFTPFAHKNINWGMTYARRAFTFRFNVAYAYKVSGAAVAPSATVPAGTFTYVAPQITQDWSFDYRFSKRFTFYGSARNFNGANKRTERAGPGSPVWTRPSVYQNFGTMVTFGVRSEF